MTQRARSTSICLGLALSLARSAGAEPAHAFALAADGVTVRDPARDHVALSRELPSAFDPEHPAFEPEAVRLLIAGPAAPPVVRVRTLGAAGALLDVLDDPSLSPWPCPSVSASAKCWATRPLRLTPDRLDRDYPAACERSLEGELGGELRVEMGAQVLGNWRVGGPHSPVFAGLERLRAKLRVRVLRLSPGGAPALGSDVSSALRIAKAEVLAASKLWAQCGIDLQGPASLDVQVVDPPPIQLVAVGCEMGLPASGGQLTLTVHGRHLRVATRPGDSPLIVAQRLARAFRALGLSAQLSPNPRTTSGAAGAVDVLVRGPHGALVSVAADLTSPLSSDPTLPICLGEVDLSNGLSHFVENDAAAGTLEERALIKAFDDGDPSTIDVFFVPSFDQSGRIGESFIDDDGAGIQNTVLIDRAAVRAGPRSYALAHELGHVLLDMPGHPDDYGVDHSSSLMDSDASDASVFGPRRLSLADCERALRESGPDARVPLLEPWLLPRRPSGATLAR